jgi:hypothetical protein
MDAGFTITPKLVSISPSTGTVGGTTLTLNVQGVGVSSTNIAIQDSTGASICDVVTITAYSAVSCVTKKQEINSSSYQVSDGTTSLACDSTNSGTSCSYSQLTATTGQPTITSLAKGSDTTIVITGTNFATADSATVTF